MMILEHAAPDTGGREGLKDMDEDPDSTRCATHRITISVDVPAAGWRRAIPGIDATVREVATAALRAGAGDFAAPEGIELSVVLADDAVVRALNRDYRGRDAPTNVLAFPQSDAPGELSPEGPVLLGDVVLALETVRREAVAQGKSAIDHASHLVVHGILHLLGFDHHVDADAADMERREIAILAGLGIADPYAGDTAPVTPAGGAGS